MTTQKDQAITFLKLAAHGKVREAYDRFIDPEFIHHNPWFKGDRESLLEAMEQAHAASPNRSFEVKKVLEDGDHVMTFSEVLRQDPKAAPIAVVHIFRFARGKVVELWDLGAEVAKDSPNENGVF